ncbi:SpoIIE family protein phosphatase [Streptomyces boninensis]|uniref:SpoIIE family protein phosphatase n=1 Tax=Streptomyces boninensis TaxID=2039455 RepID=UPI003B226D6B
MPELVRECTVGSFSAAQSASEGAVGEGSRVGSKAKRAEASISLPGDALAAAAARRFVRTALDQWATGRGLADAGLTERVAADAVLLVSELVTNAVVHAGTDVGLHCRAEPAPSAGPDSAKGGCHLIVEVTDRHAARPVGGAAPDPDDYGGLGDVDDGSLGRTGRGLRLVAELAESWGVTYRRVSKTVWFRLVLDGSEADDCLEQMPAPASIVPRSRGAAEDRGDMRWTGHSAFSFLAETSDILAGQFDEEMVASLATQLLVPRLADWSAVWLRSETAGGGAGRARLAQVWHTKESRIEPLRRALEKDPPVLPESLRAGAVPWKWPGGPAAYGPGGATLACRLVAGGREVGLLLLGRGGLLGIPGEVAGVVEDFARRVAHAVLAARQYTRQATISQVLQRGLLPSGISRPPNLETAIVYEPTEGAWAGGDFYDIFPAGESRWWFALGDVCGKGPEAAVVTGLARPVLRLLAREGHGVGEVLGKLNRTLAEETAAAVEAAAAAVSAAGVPVAGTGGGGKFLSMLCGQLVPYPEEEGGGVRCTLASAGHPLPLILRPDGSVQAAAKPQMLLGVMEDVEYACESFDLAPGDTLLCVTDGVTERRSGRRLFDDGDGLSAVLATCAGLTAAGVAERVRRAVDEFAASPPEDDLAMLVLQAR